MFKGRKIRRYWYALTRHAIGEIWMLHRVWNTQTPISRLRSYEIQPAVLERLIVAYKQKGYEFVSIEEAYVRMSSRKKCGKFVAVTLDDGYEDNFSVAYPIFKKYEVPFCIYVAPGLITDEEKADEEYDYTMMSEEQLRQLAKEPLCTLGAHTYTHVRLHTLNYEEQLAEVKKGKDWLEKITRKPIEDFAYPFGCRNDVTAMVMKELGIKRAVLAGGGRVLNNTGPLALDMPRVLVDNSYENDQD